jgi:hypothetical protein
MNWGNILGFIGLAAGVIGVAGSFFASNARSDALDKVAEQRRQSNQLAIRKQKIQKRRQQQQIIREARIKRAGAVARAQTQTGGTRGSLRGGLGSYISQASAQQGFVNQFTAITADQNAFLRQASIFSLEAREHGETANIFGSVRDFGSTIFSNRTQIASLF